LYTQVKLPPLIPPWKWGKLEKLFPYVSIVKLPPLIPPWKWGKPEKLPYVSIVKLPPLIPSWKSGRFHSLKLRSIEPVDHQYLGLFLILINQKLRKKAAIALWKRVLGK
jgi:hypothetical protein